MDTSLFILIEEYCDSTHAPSTPYIKGKSRIDSNDLFSEFKSYMDIASYFSYEKCNRYYDTENIRGVLYPYTVLETEYNEQSEEYPDINTAIRILFNEQGFMDWRDQPTSSATSYYLQQENVTDDTLGEMARKKDAGNAVVLLNCRAIEHKSPLRLASSDRRNIDIDHYDNISCLHSWFSINRQPQRVFVYNPKHGDDKHKAHNIPGTNKTAARLLTNRSETERLLKLSVGKDLTSALWYYDDIRQKYIYFENQQEIRLAFHGYHLSLGEENYDNIDINKLKQL